jgi:hypothetical protein
MLFDDDDQITLDHSKAVMIERIYIIHYAPRVHIWFRFSGEYYTEIPESQFRSKAQVFSYDEELPYP